MKSSHCKKAKKRRSSLGLKEKNGVFCKFLFYFQMVFLILSTILCISGSAFSISETSLN